MYIITVLEDESDLSSMIGVEVEEDDLDSAIKELDRKGYLIMGVNRID